MIALLGLNAEGSLFRRPVPARRNCSKPFVNRGFQGTSQPEHRRGDAQRPRGDLHVILQQLIGQLGSVAPDPTDVASG